MVQTEVYSHEIPPVFTCKAGGVQHTPGGWHVWINRFPLFSVGTFLRTRTVATPTLANASTFLFGGGPSRPDKSISVHQIDQHLVKRHRHAVGSCAVCNKYVNKSYIKSNFIMFILKKANCHVSEQMSGEGVWPHPLLFFAQQRLSAATTYPVGGSMFLLT